MIPKIRFHALGAGCACACALVLLTTPSGLVDAEPQRPHARIDPDVFERALDAARNERWGELHALEERLGEDHPMEGYLEFHRIRAQLPDASPETVRAYQREYADLPIAGSLKRVALRAYYWADRDEAIRELMDAPPRRHELQCLYWNAQLDVREDEALDFAVDHFRTGRSRPSECAALFQAARDAGRIGDAETWERIRLAYRARQRGLAVWLTGELEDGALRDAARTLGELHADPESLAELVGIGLDRPAPIHAFPEPQQGDLVADGLYALAERDPVRARQLLDGRIRRAETLGSPAYQAAGDRIAWYSMIRRIDANRAWVGAWLLTHGTPELYELRTRQAVGEQDWAGLLEWSDHLTEGQRNTARWQYWVGRARAETGDPSGAREALKSAANGLGFWALLASDRMGQLPGGDLLPARWTQEANPLRARGRFQHADLTLYARVPDDPAIARVAVFRQLEELRLARNEWQHLLDRNDPEVRRALAAYAHRSGWPELSVEAAQASGSADAIPWRFPAAYADAFTDAAASQGSDPHLLMAIARRESAFNRDAVSAAGARGLMQVLPDTAAQLSGRDPAPTPGDLLEADVSIEYGSRYFNRLQRRYSGNRVLALAAYNAGPSRVDRWLDRNAGMPYDVWIESIPYYETRGYVQAVLTYRVIFAMLHGGEVRPALLDTGEMLSAYGKDGTEAGELAER